MGRKEYDTCRDVWSEKNIIGKSLETKNLNSLVVEYTKLYFITSYINVENSK